MNINKFESKEKALDTASFAFESLLEKSEKVFRESGRNTLVFLSGGSSLEILDRVSDVFLGSNLTITTLDERFSLDTGVNTFSQIVEKDFYIWARNAGCKFIDTRIKSGDTITKMSSRIETQIGKWREDNPEGLIVATIGMGEDGHVAGLMPYPENKDKFNDLFNNPEIWYVGYDAGDKNKHPHRLTATFPLIEMIDGAVSYIVGREKMSAVKKLLAKEGSLHETPARIFRKMGEVQIFTDIEAF